MLNSPVLNAKATDNPVKTNGVICNNPFPNCFKLPDKIPLNPP